MFFVYDLKFSKTAVEYLKKLDKNINERIVASIDRIKIRPFAFVKRLVGSHYFSFRTGDYRLILSINQGEMVILVVEIGHRKNIYKNN